MRKHRKIQILFVCLGNICRSPSAEAVMKQLVQQSGRADQFRIDSAGLIDYHEGEQADPRMRAHAIRRGSDVGLRTGRHVVAMGPHGALRPVCDPSDLARPARCVRHHALDWILRRTWDSCCHRYRFRPIGLGRCRQFGHY